MICSHLTSLYMGPRANLLRHSNTEVVSVHPYSNIMVFSVNRIFIKRILRTLAQYSVQWWAFVNTMLKLPVPET